MDRIVLVFSSRTAAIQVERKLRIAGVAVRVQSPPMGTGRPCQLAVVFGAVDRVVALGIVRQTTRQPRTCWLLPNDGQARVVDEASFL